MDVIETDIADVQVNSAGATSYVNSYKIMSMLGEGTFSKVYLCQNDTGNEFALKVINKSILKRKREYKRVNGKLVLSNAFQKVQKEVAIMKKLAHSNLVKLYEVIDSPADDKLFLVLELIRGGQIMYWDDKKFRYFSRNTSTGVLEKETVRECMRDVVEALDFLHRNHICHRDIKPENILLSGDQYKLADFGVAHMNEAEPSVTDRTGTLTLRSTEGTYHFLAPECTTGDEYDPYQVDVWALGVTMFTLLLGTLPFGNRVASLSDVMTSIRVDPLILPPDLDPECAQLLTQLLEKNPRVRITVPGLQTHSWLSGSSGDLTQRPSDMEVMVTQQEIEAAFTPVNNFILVMKLKMKMSSRLNNVRKSLANNVNGARRAEAVPVTKHTPVSSAYPTEDNSDGGKFSVPKTLEMTPSEQPRMTDKLQRRSSRLAETISDTVGSLTTTLTRRKSQLGAISAVFDDATPIVSSSPLEEDSPGKEDTNRPGALLRRMSSRTSRSVRSLISDMPQQTDSASEKNVDGLSTDQRDVDAVALSSSFRNSLTSLSMSKSDTGSSPNLHRLSKRKSTSSRGPTQAAEIPEGERTSESTSPMNRKKRRESLPATRDITSDLSAQTAIDAVKIGESPVQKKILPSKTNIETNSNSPPRGLSRENSMSFRALVSATPELLASENGHLARNEPLQVKAGPDVTNQDSLGDGTVAQVNGESSLFTATTRPVVLSRRRSRRNSKSSRPLTTFTDTSQHMETVSVARILPTQVELSPVKNESNAEEPGSCLDDSVDVSSSINVDESPDKPGATRPLPLQQSKRNSVSFRAPVPKPEDGAGTKQEEGSSPRSCVSDNTSSPKFWTEEVKSTETILGNSQAKFESGKPPGILARRLSRHSSTSFRALPLTIDTTHKNSNTSGAEMLEAKDPSSELLSTKTSADTSDNPIQSASPTKLGLDSSSSTRMSAPNSPQGSPKVKLNVEQPSSLGKAKLPVLETHLSLKSPPMTSPPASPCKAADCSDDESSADSTATRRSSSSSKSIASARLASLKVASLSRKRSSSLKLDGFSSSSDEGEKETLDLLPMSTTNASTSDQVTNLTQRTKVWTLESPDYTVQDRRSTFSSKPTTPLLEQGKSPLTTPRRLHRNRSMNFVDGDDSNVALTRETSLAKVLDACISTRRAADRSVEESTSSKSTSPTAQSEIETSTIPTRRHQGHVPPLVRQEDQSDSAWRHGRHHQVSPLASPPRVEFSPQMLDSGGKSPPVLERARSRRRSLVQAQDSLRVLFRGKSSVRLSILDEKRGAHYVTDRKVAAIKSKVCGIM